MKFGIKHYSFIGIGLIVFVFVILTSIGTSKLDFVHEFSGNMTEYKSSSCGCCGLYAKYYQSQGNENLKVVGFQSDEELDNFKDSLGIPKDLRSCHTTVIGKYFVEGHMPLEVIEKLLKEQPDIAGIAMPGMPEGSPGMPGTKKGDFIVYSVNHDGSYQEFMRY
jgi:hypothetical protein